MTASGTRVMAFDVPASRPWHPGKSAMYVVIGGTPAEITGAWDRMLDGATVLQPLAPSPWAPLCGMLKDRFDITWVLTVPAQAGT